jgi:hypothetical protein
MDSEERVTQELGDIEKNIRDLIVKLYDCCYAGQMKVIPLPTKGYQINFGLPDIERPLSLSIELEGDDFYNKLTEWLRFGGYSAISRYTLQLTYEKS